MSEISSYAIDRKKTLNTCFFPVVIKTYKDQHLGKNIFNVFLVGREDQDHS